MAGFIRNLKNPFTGKFIFPVTKTRAVYDDKGNRLDNLLEAMKSIAGNNILINSNFANPVNQRGVTFPYATANTYFIDRWFVNEYTTVSKTSKGLKLTSGSSGAGFIKQTVEDSLTGQYVTLSAMVDSKILQLTWNVETNSSKSFSDGNATLTISCSGNYTSVDIASNAGTSIEIEWVKLEYGKASTPYIPRLYAEELQLCKRYFKRIAIKEWAYAGSNDTIYFGHTYTDVNHRMRVTPSVSFHSESAIYTGGTQVTGWMFNIVSATDWNIKIAATKASHGLSLPSSLVTITSVLDLDAEL